MSTGRVITDGKHLRLGDTRFSARGVTYGSFLPRADGARFPPPDRIARDVEHMHRLGLNTIRVYDTPPTDLLDAVTAHDLRLIVGADYRDWRDADRPGRATHRAVLDAGRRALDELLDRCAGRPEVLAVTVGNEVPADVARVHGIHAVEDVLSALVQHVHAADPALPTTYTSFPSTEYLTVDGIDLHSFNVFLEDPEAFRRYVRHLQIVSSDRPLLITELGLASAVHDPEAQARLLEHQLRIIDEEGCAGAMVFAYTDEWGVNGRPVEGWGFGITTADRAERPAAAAVREWAGRPMKALRDEWPRISVIVCAHNEERTLLECLTALAACDYPDLEVIVCDDGSTDATAEIARAFPAVLLELPHGGLSRARNAGIQRSTGAIVAFCDADAACHPQWPWYLALAFDQPSVHAAGGPNLPFAEAGVTEQAVALSPGSPCEVLHADDRAEHVPGCNMAFRREVLLAVGGFDPVYTSAGDDVDVCWKVLEQGGEIAFAPAAQVCHHRRATVRGYLRQQRGYGRAEAMLARAHPHRFNGLGQARWSGVIYGGVGLLPRLLRPVVYHGSQGLAPYQGITRRRSPEAAAWAGALLPAVPAIAAVLFTLAFASSWFAAAAVGVAALVPAFGIAMAIATPRTGAHAGRLRATVGWLHVAQPFVRTWGRLRAPRHAAHAVTARPWWGDRAAWLLDLERMLRAEGLGVRIGGPTDEWDLDATAGPALRTRITLAVAWGWVPRAKVRTRPRRRWWALVAAAAAAAALSWWIVTIVALVGAGLGVIHDFLAGHRLVRTAVHRAVEQAAAPSPSP
ncbi:MAG: glycosyltransferase [Actinomycetota bacterium]